MNDDDLIGKWQSNTPGDEPVDKVERVLIKYFGQDAVRKSGGSHQYRIKHKDLVGLAGFDMGGYLSIPVSGGQRVKKFYLRRIAQAIKQLKEVAERRSDEE